MKLVFSVLTFLALGGVCYPEERSPVFVTYTIWVGDERPSKIETLPLITKKNATLYEVMKLAAYIDTKYEFETQLFNGLHYVTSIGGLEQDLETNHYWMLYKLRWYPNPFRPPKDDQLSSVGVDGIFTKNFDNYLFWYKNTTGH